MHGCARLETPLWMAQCLFSDPCVGWRISAMGMPGSKRANFARQVENPGIEFQLPFLSVYTGTAYKCN